MSLCTALFLVVDQGGKISESTNNSAPVLEGAMTLWLYVARKQPKKHNGEIWTVDFSEPTPISGHISDSVTCQGNP